MTRTLNVAVAVSVVLLVLGPGPLVFALDDHSASGVATGIDTAPPESQSVSTAWSETNALSADHWTQGQLLSVSSFSPVSTDELAAPYRRAVTPVVVSVQQGAIQSGEANLLDNEKRRKIYEAVERSPGTYTARIAEVTSIPRSTVRYHLRVLEDADLVTSETVRGKQRYVASTVDDAEATLAAAYTDEATASVLDALRRTMPATVSELAEEIDRTPGTVSHHLSRLEADGLVERERSGNAVLNRLAGGAQAAVSEETADSGPSLAPSDD